VFPGGVREGAVRARGGASPRARGGRCDHCHTAKAGQQRRDFALDDKAEKKTARVMMQMTRDLNDKYIPTLEDHSDPPIKVQCITCHRGIAHPRPLADVLKLAYASGGLHPHKPRYPTPPDRDSPRA